MYCRTNFCLVTLALLWPCPPAVAADAPQLKLAKGDHVVLIGNTLAERMQYFGHFETLLHSRFPELELVVRNLGWSADELTLRPRSQDFKDHGHTLADHKADVILAFFGFNESFAGEKGLPKFEADLEKFITETLATKYNGTSAAAAGAASPDRPREHRPPRLSRRRGEQREHHALHRGDGEDRGQAQGACSSICSRPTQKLMAEAKAEAADDQRHSPERARRPAGRRSRSTRRCSARGRRPQGRPVEKLRAEVNEKNLQFFYDYRAVNGFYIYGGRKNPFGVVNFPAEFAKLRKMIANRDQRIWAVAQGKTVPATIDDSDTGEIPEIETNFKNADHRSRRRKRPSRSSRCPRATRSTVRLGGRVPRPAEAGGRSPSTPRAGCGSATMPSYPQYLPGSRRTTRC